MSIYIGEFNNKSDLEQLFNCGSLDYCHILFASYELGDYCGDAFVLFIENGKLYEINACHCSCYGLEEQWMPEETMFSVLEHRINNGNLNQLLGGYASEILNNIKKLDLS